MDTKPTIDLPPADDAHGVVSRDLFGEHYEKVMPMYNRAMRERDAWNSWSVEVASKLGIPTGGFASHDVGDQYAELRERIMAAISSPNTQALPRGRAQKGNNEHSD